MVAAVRADSGATALQAENAERVAEVSGARAAADAAQQSSRRLEEEKLGLLMRAETAEARATASSNELVDAAQRYAKEISALKAKLAEKEAQLMGGFGSLANLALGEMPRMRAPSPSALGLAPLGGITPAEPRAPTTADVSAKPTPPAAKKPSMRGRTGATARARRGG